MGRHGRAHVRRHTGAIVVVSAGAAAAAAAAGHSRLGIAACVVGVGMFPAFLVGALYFQSEFGSSPQGQWCSSETVRVLLMAVVVAVVLAVTRLFVAQLEPRFSALTRTFRLLRNRGKIAAMAAHLALLLLVVVVPSAPASAQDVVPEVASELVQLDAVVTDAKGQIVRGLTNEDFEVREDGKRQPVIHFLPAGASSRAPLTAEAD